MAGCGYVGHRVARIRAAEGREVHVLTRSEKKADEFREEGIHPIVMDLTTPRTWPTLPETDVIVWAVGFDRSPGTDRRAVWHDGLQHLLRAVPFRSTARRVIYTSSTGVYGDGGGQDVDEQTPENPVSEGGRACLEAENLLRRHSEETGTPVLILRLAGIYGPDRLLRRISQLQNGEPIAAVPDEWLNLVHVDDVVRMIQWAADSEIADWPHNVLNVVSARSVTRREYYETLAALMATKLKTRVPPPRFVNPENAESASRQRGRNGNRRIVSRYRSKIPVSFQFDDIRNGLQQATEKSTRES